jgi:hypothetical protein
MAAGPNQEPRGKDWPPGGDWVIHPVLAGILTAPTFGVAAFSVTVNWFWLVMGSGLGFVVGWGVARLGRSVGPTEPGAAPNRRDE